MKKLRYILLLPCIALVFAFTTRNDKLFEISKNIELFVSIYKEINTHYVDEVDPSELMRTGVDAMLKSLDPYTNYISESQVESYRLNTERRYDGIGATTRSDGDYITIVEPLEGSPAYNAGLRAGDVIVEVEGESTKGRTVEELGRIVRGFPGTTLRLGVKKYGKELTEQIALTRDEINIPNVPHSSMVSDGIAYVSLSTFTMNAGKNIEKAIKDLKKENDLNGVILDLRNNGGGLLMEAVNVCNIFVPKDELIVSTKGKLVERDQEFKTRNIPHDLEIPVVVLINKNSASASEIVSGTIQDLDRGVVMGQRSFGKGLVQNHYDIGYNSKVKVTTAKYYIPSGRCIQSVSYSEGEPVDIPDEERSVFYTRKKRPVLAGGGVTPDEKLEVEKDTELVEHLKKQHVIFNYVSEWCTTRDSIAPIGEFSFENYNEFVAFAKDYGFEYQTSAEEQTETLLKTLSGSDLESEAKAQLEDLRGRIRIGKENAFENERENITNLIEKEIATRYYFQKGKVQQQLLDDTEVKQAVDLLNNEEKYNQILSNK